MLVPKIDPQALKLHQPKPQSGGDQGGVSGAGQEREPVLLGWFSLSRRRLSIACGTSLCFLFTGDGTSGMPASGAHAVSLVKCPPA